MVWGCMSSSGTGMLFTYEGRIEFQHLHKHVGQSYQHSLEKIFNNNISYGVIFRQDNARCHTSRVSKGWLEKKEVGGHEVASSIPWHKSHWTFVVMLSYKNEGTEISFKRESEVKLHEEWQKIEWTTCAKLVFNRHIKANIKAKRAYTKN